MSDSLVVNFVSLGILLNEYDILSEQGDNVALLLYGLGCYAESTAVLRLCPQQAKIDYDFDDLYAGEFIKKGNWNVVWKAYTAFEDNVYFRKDITNYTGLQWIEIHNGRPLNYYEYMGCSLNEKCIFLLRKSDDSIYKLFENRIQFAQSSNQCLYEGAWQFRPTTPLPSPEPSESSQVNLKEVFFLTDDLSDDSSSTIIEPYHSMKNKGI